MAIDIKMTKIMSMTKKVTVPVAVQLECCDAWSVTLEGGSDPHFRFSFQLRPGRGAGYYYSDGFEVRDAFLAIRSPEDALHFFEQFGPFEVLPSPTTGQKRRATTSDTLRWSVVQQARKELEDALQADEVPSHVYNFVFWRPLPVQLFFGAVTPQTKNEQRDAAIVECADVADAVRASVFLDRMGGFRWKRCARRGCDELFTQKTRTQKIYCGSRCAHLQAVNDYNAREAHKQKRKSAPGL
jgi:hypothetical protein